MQAPIVSLMQVHHEAYKYANSPYVIPETEIPAFLDLCSKVINEFMNMIQSNEEIKDLAPFYIIDKVIEELQFLLENDEPVEFHEAKQKFEDNTLRQFHKLMSHLSQCVEKPTPLKEFYLNLASKLQQIFDTYIRGNDSCQ